MREYRALAGHDRNTTGLVGEFETHWQQKAGSLRGGRAGGETSAPLSHPPPPPSTLLCLDPAPHCRVSVNLCQLHVY